MIGFPNNNSFIADSKGRQIYDRGKTNETDRANTSEPADNRKHTVLRITVTKQSQNQNTGQPKVLLLDNSPKDKSTAMLQATAQRTVQDMLQGVRIPLTFHVNTKPPNEDVSINKLLSDMPLPKDKEDFNTSNALQNPKISESPTGKSPDIQDKLEPKVVLEAKLAPLRIGIHLDEDKKNDAENDSAEIDHVSLQDVLKDIDDSSKTSNTTEVESNPEKENSVVIDLNDDTTKGSKPNVKQTNFDKNERKLGKVHLEVISHKDNKNGTDVETAGVSITTESKGLQTNSLIKILLSKLLGSDISDALKGKVAKEIKYASGLKIPSDDDQKQRPVSSSPSLDEASTAAAGTLVESPPGTVQGVDTAEMNNGAGQPLVSPPVSAAMPAPIRRPPPPPPPIPSPSVPTVVPSHPECAGGSPQLLLLNPAGDRVPGNHHPSGGRDCSYEMQKLPNIHVSPSSPGGMLLESSFGPSHGLGTGIPSSAAAPPSPFARLSSNGGSYASTNAAGQGVESPPGTTTAVGTSSSPSINEIQRGDHGKIT